MARWRLTSAHYLNVEGVEWDYVERDQKTNRQKRVHFKVPLHLDPNDPSDHNDKANEWIIVSDGNNPNPRDIIFIGPPTPDMEPMDAEAEAITAQHRVTWDATHPINSLASNSGGYSQSLLEKFQGEFEAKLKQSGGTYPTDSPYSKGIDPAKFEALQTQVGELVKQNTQLIAMLQQQMNPMMVVAPSPVPAHVQELRDKEDDIRQEMAEADGRRA